MDPWAITGPVKESPANATAPHVGVAVSGKKNFWPEHETIATNVVQQFGLVRKALRTCRITTAAQVKCPLFRLEAKVTVVRVRSKRF